jgi:hypothetical protein
MFTVDNVLSILPGKLFDPDAKLGALISGQLRGACNVGEKLSPR